MIFDFDGILVSTGLDLIFLANYTLKRLGYEPRKDDEIISFIGDGVKDLLERALRGNNLADYSEAFRIFTNHYRGHILDNTALYPGVEEIMISSLPKIPEY